MNTVDAFEELARYYDEIMTDINYDRWVFVTEQLAALTGARAVRHLDVACGTGKLAKDLTRRGWHSTGVDLSWGMVRTARRSGTLVPVLQADMAALPFAAGSFDVVTCLFDSLNFLLEPELVARTIGEFQRILSERGVVYFDFVTERMVIEHFENQRWTENNGRFSTTWIGQYDRKRQIADTLVQVNSGVASTIRERVYPVPDIRSWVEEANMELLALVDAETWKPITRRTIRVDAVAVRRPATRTQRKTFAQVARTVAEALA